MHDILEIAKERAKELFDEAVEFDGHFYNINDYVRDWLADDEEMNEIDITTKQKKDELFYATKKEVDKLITLHENLKTAEE